MPQLADLFPPAIYFLHFVLGTLGVLLAIVALGGVKGCATQVRAGLGFVMRCVHGSARAVRGGFAGLTVVMAMASVLSCGREVTGPEGGRLSRAVSLQPTLRVQSGAALVASGVDFARMRLTLGRSDGTIAYDRVVDFPASADSLRLAVAVTLSREAPPDGERMALRVGLITSAGDTVFRNGPDTLLMELARSGVPPRAVDVRLFYTGPGAQATRVVLTPTSFDTTSGSALTFSAQAFDAQNALVSNAPILFTSADTALLRFANARSGSATTSVRRGSALAIASLLTGPADSSTVALALPASRIAAVSGGGQSALNGTALPAPVVVFVSASDSVAVPGVTVLFAAAAGGLVANASVVTDANGRASTTWTLGTSSGVQNLTATAMGLTGSPLTLTATSLAGAATQLAFVTQPSTATAGSSLGGITVQARDVSGNLDLTYVGAVTIGVGTNPAAGTLSGTTTVNAVGGMATFPGLSVNLPAAGYTLAATAAGLTGTTSTPFNIAVGPAATLAFSVQPVNSGAGASIDPAVQVTARDAAGNTATAFTGAVTIAIENNPGGATLSGPTTVNAIAGVATFAGLSLNVGAVGVTLTASASGLTGATSAAFTTLVERIEWTNAAGGLWSAAANWSLARAPRQSDSVVIALPGTYTVTLDTTFVGTLLTVGGGSGAQTLALTSRTLALSGPLSVQSTGSLALHAATVAASVINAGTVLASGRSALTGALTTTAGSVVRVAALVPGDTNTLTVANGFTNLGSIELTKIDASGAWSASLAVTTGTLVNAPGGTITALFGAIGGGSFAGDRSLRATLDNRGIISVPDLRTDLNIWTPTGAVSENSGTIMLSPSGSDLRIFQSQIGTSGSFTNRGAFTIPTGRLIGMHSGRFTHAAGATLSGDGLVGFFNATAVLEGDVTLGRLQASSGSSVAVGAGASVSVTQPSLFSSTMSGPGTLTIGAGQELLLYNGTVTAPIVVSGSVLSRGASRLDGSVTTAATSLITIGADPGRPVNTLTVASGFVNLGTISLENDAVGSGVAFDQRMTVSSGTLVNAPGATIRARRGIALTGPRTLTAQLDNQGTLDIFPDTAGLFTINGNVTTSGIINVDVGGLTAGTEYGRVAVNGTLSLGGTLNVGLFGGYVPVSTNTFTILTSTGARTGTFATANFTAPLALPVTYSANAVTVGVP